MQKKKKKTTPKAKPRKTKKETPRRGRAKPAAAKRSVKKSGPQRLIGELFLLGFQGRTVPKWLREFEQRFGLGGVILFDYDVQTKTYERNIFSPAQVKLLCAEFSALSSKPLICVDQEGGKVCRLKEKLGFAPLPSAFRFNKLPAAEKVAIIERAYREMKELGFHYVLAPVVDLNLNPGNPDIGAVERSYSDNPNEVRTNVDILSAAATEVGLGLCLKHYPGLGGAKTNSHLELTDLSDVLTRPEVDIFHEMAPEIEGEAVLVSHGLVKQWDSDSPISMSPNGLSALRTYLPDVLLISDDLQMQGLQKKYSTPEACLRGIHAGIDLLLIGNNLIHEEATIFGIAEDLQTIAAEDPVLLERCERSAEKVRSRKQWFSEPSQ